MKVIRPYTVTDAGLTSNVPETAPAAYNAGTAYGVGDRVSVTTGLVSLVYESIQAGNTGKTPASSPLWWLYIGTTYTAYNAGTTYALGEIAISTTTHRRYESLAGSNLGNALTDEAWWLDIGPTNRWAMFDQQTGTTTECGEPIDVTVAVTGRADSIAILDTNAATVQIVVTIDAVEEYNKTHDLRSTDGITDWYAYFFEDVVQRRNLIVTDLPVGLNPSIDVIATLTGGTVSIGSCIIGRHIEIGSTQYGAGVGIIDYSRKTVDDFGNYTITERAFSRRGRFTVMIENKRLDAIIDTLADYRATPIVWIATDEYTSSQIFGFYKELNAEIAYPSHSICTLEIEGLT